LLDEEKNRLKEFNQKVSNDEKSEETSLNNEIKSSSLPADKKDSEEMKEDQEVRKLITKLKTAPRTIEKQRTFEEDRKEMAHRFKSLSTKTSKSKTNIGKKYRTTLANTFPIDAKTPPHNTRKQDTISSLIQEVLSSSPTAEHVENNDHLDEKDAPTTDRRVAQRKLLEDARNLNQEKETVSTDRHLPEAFAPNDEMGPILSLIQKMIPRTGSWKVKGEQVQYHESKHFHLDPKIIDVLAEAHKKGLLSKLTFDQAFILNHNLKIIDRFHETKRSHQQNILLNIIPTIESHLIALWIQEDYQQKLLYKKCHKLMDRINQQLENEQGRAVKGHARLFEEPTSPELLDLIEEWQYSHLYPKKVAFRKKINLTIYEDYQILKAYLQYLPEPMRQAWGSLKQTQSRTDWFTAFDQLQHQDKVMIVLLLKMLKTASLSIWKDDVKGMLNAVNCLTSLICPLRELQENGTAEKQKAEVDITLLSDLLSS
jgi:hypothetical protein